MPQYWGLEQLKPDRKPTGLLLPITVLKGNLEIFTDFFFSKFKFLSKEQVQLVWMLCIGGKSVDIFS